MSDYLRLVTFLQFGDRYPGYWHLGRRYNEHTCKPEFSGQILCRSNGTLEIVCDHLDPADEPTAEAICDVMNLLHGGETLPNVQSTLRRTR